MDKTPGFLTTFFGSLTNFKQYPHYVRRSGPSMAGHYLLLITLCCSFYALLSTAWLNRNLSPYLNDLASSVPAITIKDGKASTDVEEPYFFTIEEEKVAVIDTTQDPQVYFDQFPAIVVLSENRISTKDANGKIESYELPQEFALDAATVQGWVDRVEEGFLPVMFLLCFFWQVCWKAVQVLFAATVVTLIQKSRPDFATHWKLANLALVPAMVFGLLVFAAFLGGVSVPFSGFVFWLILGGLTYHGSEQLRKSPTHS